MTLHLWYVDVCIITQQAIQINVSIQSPLPLTHGTSSLS